MTDAKIPASPSATSRLEQLFPKLTPRQLARLSTQGRTRTIAERELLIAIGSRAACCFVVLSGEVEIIRRSELGEDVIAVHGPGTSLPGVFAVGDVRSGSLKRVASALGERSIAMSFVPSSAQ
jgi:thioredoxin reductase (NADPH)